MPRVTERKLGSRSKRKKVRRSPEDLLDAELELRQSLGAFAYRIHPLAVVRQMQLGTYSEPDPAPVLAELVRFLSELPSVGADTPSAAMEVLGAAMRLLTIRAENGGAHVVTHTRDGVSVTQTVDAALVVACNRAIDALRTEVGDALRRAARTRSRVPSVDARSGGRSPRDGLLDTDAQDRVIAALRGGARMKDLKARTGFSARAVRSLRKTNEAFADAVSSALIAGESLVSTMRTESRSVVAPDGGTVPRRGKRRGPTAGED